MKTIFFSTHCPLCNILQGMLDKKQIQYEMIDDIDTVLSIAKKYNIKTAPFAEVDDKLFNAMELREYINNI